MPIDGTQQDVVDLDDYRVRASLLRGFGLDPNRCSVVTEDDLVVVDPHAMRKSELEHELQLLGRKITEHAGTALGRQYLRVRNRVYAELIELELATDGASVVA